MNTPDQKLYRFDGIEIDTGRMCLRHDGKERHVRQKTFQVLLYLLERRERLVTKEELIDHIWPDTAVTDNSLERCLTEIRKVLGDDSRNPRFIKTVPRAGYRFIGVVEEVEFKVEEVALSKGAVYASAKTDVLTNGDAHPPKIWSKQPLVLAGAIVIILGVAILVAHFARTRTVSTSLTGTTLPQDPTKQSVAVMFFENRSGIADLDWLSEGLADMVITGLSRSKKITVLSRQQLSVLRDRAGRKSTDRIELEEALEIARHSQAKFVVLGTFARLGQQIRIDVHLHNGADGQLLTAERLIVDDSSQILSQVDLLSLKLATYLGAGSSEPKTELSNVMTNSLEAYRYYSLGLEKAQEVRNEEAIALLQQAIDLDRTFAMAYARIGYVHVVKGSDPVKGRPFLEKAYQLADRLTEKDKLYISAWYAIVNLDYESAIKSFRQIIVNYPLDVEAYSHLARLLRGEDRAEEALEIAKQGLVIDADSTELYNRIGATYSDLGRHDEALTMFRRYVELAPNEPNSHDSLAMGLQWSGRYSEAIAEYERALTLKPDFHIAIIHLGNTYFQQGRYSEALKQYDRYIQLAQTELDRGRGWFSKGLIYLKLEKLALAEQAGQLHLKSRKSGADNLFLLALERGDLAGAKSFLQMIESRTYFDRGARGYSRDMFFYRGYFELKSGNVQQAIDLFKEALRRRPLIFSIDPYEDCLANVYLVSGRYDEAIAEYERILKLNPNYPLVHYQLAKAYEFKNQKEHARAEYTRFLEIWRDADSDIPEVVSARKYLRPATPG